VGIREWQERIRQWSEEKLPGLEAQAVMLKTFEELSEVVRDPTDELEHADLLILVLDLANKCGIDIESALERKMLINQQREWTRDPMTGFYRRVK
jgi:NTP pyrophosphatase (non-canonical NTP hydrolase)